MWTREKSSSSSMSWERAIRFPFFLQAEDGIRAGRVTGVQTCALPISGDAVEGSAAFVDHGPNPEESCWRRERTKLLGEAINRLGPKLRSTILLCDIEERSLQEKIGRASCREIV